MEYATISDQGESQVVAAPQLDGVDFTASPELAHELLGYKVSSPFDIAHLAKTLQMPHGHATVILAARNGRTQLVLDVPMAAFADTTPKGLTKLTAVMRRAARETGRSEDRRVGKECVRTGR